VPDSGKARLPDEALGNCNLSSNGYLSLRASWRSFGEAVAVQEDGCRGRKERANQRGRTMLDLTTIKITQRDEQVLKLLVQGCSNKEIAAQLNISPRTVKQHLRTLFLRAGIRDGRKRVKLATAMFVKEQTNHATS
jgi:DNA-binding NarL/FixJ family response regulator